MSSAVETWSLNLWTAREFSQFALKSLCRVRLSLREKLVGAVLMKLSDSPSPSLQQEGDSPTVLSSLSGSLVQRLSTLNLETTP